MGDSLPRTPLNHRAKFDGSSFILAEEICNRTNKITKKQTVNDIPTPCLSACVDNKLDEMNNARYYMHITVTERMRHCYKAVRLPTVAHASYQPIISRHVQTDRHN